MFGSTTRSFAPDRPVQTQEYQKIFSNLADEYGETGIKSIEAGNMGDAQRNLALGVFIYELLDQPVPERFKNRSRQSAKNAMNDCTRHHCEILLGPRFTIDEAARREVLGRLLELNHQRYAEEVAAGLHEKGASGKRRGQQSEIRDQSWKIPGR